MRVGLITYQTGHKKTIDVTLKLLSRGHIVTWFAFPFDPLKMLKLRLPVPYPDRPYQLTGHDPEEFCKAAGVRYVKMHGWGDEHARDFRLGDPAVYLHCTSKIIPPRFLDGNLILNCHPGLLPKNRGVDAFKWSIINGWPIGVTLHAIDEVIDRGVILFRREIPILSCDLLEDVCARAYEFECDLLANFDAHLHNLKRDWRVGDEHPISHKRIPAEQDVRLDTMFTIWKYRPPVVSLAEYPA